MKADIIEKIEKHTNADSLYVAITIHNKQFIIREGEFIAGDGCIVFEAGEKLPIWLLKNVGLWDNEKKKGKLAGKLGDRVKIGNIREVRNDGVIYKTVNNVISETDYTVVKLWDKNTQEKYQTIYFEEAGSGSAWSGIFASEFLRDKNDKNSYLTISKNDFAAAIVKQIDINNESNFGYWFGVESAVI